MNIGRWILSLLQRSPRRAYDPTTLPVPSQAIRDRIAPASDEQTFLANGQKYAIGIDRSLGNAGHPLSDMRDVLDFGCGCGRILRWFADRADRLNLYGTDIDAPGVEWCQQHLPFATVSQNDEMPPLRYADGSFDLVLALSVFTHIDEAHQDAWLAELKRVLRPGGILVASVIGSGFREHLVSEGIITREFADRVEREGHVYSPDNYWNAMFPEWYANAYHTEAYVRSAWGPSFTVLQYLRSAFGFRQDTVICRRAR